MWCEKTASGDEGTSSVRLIGALSRATTDGADRIGLFALLRELKDPGVRNGIAFGLNVLRTFGAELPNATPHEPHAGA